MTSQAEPAPAAGKITLPDIPALCANAKASAILTTDGEIRVVDHVTARQIIDKKPVLVCHAPYTQQQLEVENILGFDVLELFAFVHPAKFCVPTPTGLAKALGLLPPTDFDSQPMTLLECAQALLTDLRQDIWQAKANPLKIAGVMGGQGSIKNGGWNWTPFIFSALGEEYDPRIPVISKTDLNIWKNLPEWSEEAPLPPPSHYPVTGEESRARLKKLLGENAEIREQQIKYTEILCSAFMPVTSPPYPPASGGGHKISTSACGGGHQIRSSASGGGHKISSSASSGEHQISISESGERHKISSSASGGGHKISSSASGERHKISSSASGERHKISTSASGGGHKISTSACGEEYQTSPPACGGEDAPASGEEHQPHVVLAEAGTGVGKTLGYLAPASLWAEKNQGTVWISTYTKNLQRQVDQELDRLYPDAQLKDNKVAVRKGRENYLCLLNLEESAAGAALSRNPRQAIALGIMARWAAASKDGDLVSGADFPGWLSGLLGYQYTTGLSDRRGECIYSACDHYHRCFVEQSIRRSKHADIVVANHALVMIQTAIAANHDDLPLRYVFDEGHHLFDAADSAFAGHLTARETYDLRRWLRGSEAGYKSRMRGLKSRAEDLISGDIEAEKDLQDILENARHLTAYGWQTRLKENNPKGACEKFILSVYEQVYSRSNARNTPYSLETGTFPLHDSVTETIPKLKKTLKSLQKSMLSLANRLRKKLNDHADTLESDTKKRLDAVSSALERRVQINIGTWINMLETLQELSPPSPPASKGDLGGEFVDWMEIERIDGRATDIGLYRHWVDPMIPFSAALKPQAHGIIVTSATLRDGTDSPEDNWKVAKQRTGVEYLSENAVQESFTSPFDYKNQTKIFVITDVEKNDLGQVSTAYQKLFEASGGGAIGLFTAIFRLKAVHEKIKMPLNDKNLTLYSQHMDDMDAGTLVDIFRDDTHACLLGTDAIRDGVDVPGESLRLIVFDRVPWPRPNLLHKARREAFGKKRYDDMLTRLKLKQAYGRLIRRADDKGVFVMLDSMMPSRMHGAFPEGVEIEHIGLAEATTKIKEFLG